MKNLASLLVVLFPLLIMAQSLPKNISVVRGEKHVAKLFTSVSGLNVPSAYALPNGETVVINPLGFQWHQYDENMNLTYLSSMDESGSYFTGKSNVLFGNNKVYMFFAKINESGNKLDFYAKVYDVETKEMMQKHELYSIPFDEKESSVILNVISSNDNSKIAVIMKSKSSEVNETIQISCYDSGLNLLWAQNDMELDANDKYLNNFQIDNAGNIYQLHMSKIDGENKLSFSVYTDDESGAHSTPFELSAYTFFDISYNVNENHGAITMFYGESECVAKGVVFAKYDKKHNILDEPVFTEFPSSVLANEMCYGESEGLYGYSFRKLIPLKNGNYAFIAEQLVYNDWGQNYVRTGCIKEKGKGNASNVYNSGAFLVAFFSPEGEVIRFVKVPKSLHAGYDIYIKSGIFSNGTSVFFLYNDNCNNNGGDCMSPLAYNGGKKCANVLAEVNESGDVSKYFIPANITARINNFLPYCNNDSSFLYIIGMNKINVGKITAK